MQVGGSFNLSLSLSTFYTHMSHTQTNNNNTHIIHGYILSGRPCVWVAFRDLPGVCVCVCAGAVCQIQSSTARDFKKRYFSQLASFCVRTFIFFSAVEELTGILFSFSVAVGNFYLQQWLSQTHTKIVLRKCQIVSMWTNIFGFWIWFTENCL